MEGAPYLKGFNWVKISAGFSLGLLHKSVRGVVGDTLWQNASEKGPFFATTFSRPFEDQSGAWLNGTSFGLNDLEALINVAAQAKEWIAAHVLKQ